MLDLARTLKMHKARRIFCVATFGLFTDGVELFNEAHAEGTFDYVFCSNLIYRDPELREAPWFVEVDMSRFVALIIDALNHNASIGSLVDQTEKSEIYCGDTIMPNDIDEAAGSAASSMILGERANNERQNRSNNDFQSQQKKNGSIS